MQNYVYANVHVGISHKIQNMEATQISTTRMAEENAV